MPEYAVPTKRIMPLVLPTEKQQNSFKFRMSIYSQSYPLLTTFVKNTKHFYLWLYKTQFRIPKISHLRYEIIFYESQSKFVNKYIQISMISYIYLAELYVVFKLSSRD